MKILERLFGIDKLYEQINDLQLYITGLRGSLSHVQGQCDNLKLQIAVNNRALGKVIAQIDPNFLVPEDDPTRKAASDALGNEVIRKLIGEHRANNRGEFE